VQDEVDLATSFLEIEKIRFGPRLQVRLHVDEETKALYVPPLLLQPLVENAVGHGIAHLIEGGEISITASRNGSRLTLRVENPCDPDGPKYRGHGIGIQNVRSRLKTLFGPEAQLDTSSLPDGFRAEIVLPAESLPSATPPQQKMQVS
jgi:two-component system sensor histidine kinase AlgZ